MKNRQIIFALIVLCLFLLPGPVRAETKPIAQGARFPDLTFIALLDKEERSYLGLSRKANFSLKDMKGTLFLIEVFSTYCTSCPKDVPVLNEVYSIFNKDPGLVGRVKVIGIAAGNNDKEVESFKKEYKVSYPILTDPHFRAHKSLGNPRVPYTIMVRKNKKEIVVYAHQGVLDSADEVISNVRGFLSK